MRVFCDFDGTISTVDSTDHILTRFADPRWAAVEQEWIAGEITAAECMRRQIPMINASEAALDAELAQIQLSDGFVEFVGWCAERGMPVTIISDGVDRFIRPILARHGLAHLPIVCNRMAGAEMARVLEQPWMREDCGAKSGVCKCAARGERGPFVYVGDGRSDFCIGAQADILFAKTSLADHAESIGKPYLSFLNFHDVTAQLADVLGEVYAPVATEMRHVRRP